MTDMPLGFPTVTDAHKFSGASDSVFIRWASSAFAMLDDDKITSHMRVVTIRVAGALAERLVTTDAATGRPINTDPSATRLIEAVGHKLEHLANARGRRYVSGSPAFSGELPVHIEFIRAGARDAYWVADTLAGHAAGHEAL